MIKKLSKYRLEFIAAGSGAIVMVMELVGSRMVAPYLGTSLYVWTAIIGVILGALSLGYWYGGRVADRGVTDTDIMKTLTLSAACILVTIFLQEAVLELVAELGDVRLSAFFAALVLFAPAAVLLGVISPCLVRLKLDTLRTAGTAVGGMYAASTFGSIAGTFLAGYWLIAWFGNRHLGLALVISLILLSLFASPRGWWPQRVTLVVLAFTGLLTGSAMVIPGAIADIDTAYNRYWVIETAGEKRVRSLADDPFGTQSAQIVGDPDTLLFGYTQRFKDVVDALRPQKMLVIGGGTFTFPLAVARAYPDSEVIAVEIDPALTQLAKKYFSLREYDNLDIVNADGRVFLNQNASQFGTFQTIFMDAFSSLTPPYQLATTEAVKGLRSHLAPGGVVVVNIIAEAENSDYLSAVVASYRHHFSTVDVYQVGAGIDLSLNQNLLIVASNDSAVANHAGSAVELPRVNIASGSALTDDHAPVEQLIHRQ